MSQDNVEIVRGALDAWNRGDWDAAFEDVAAKVEFDTTRDLGEWRGFYTGADQMKRVWTRFAEPWESVQFEPERLIDGGDRVVSRVKATLIGRDGIEVTAHNNWVWIFDDGRVTRLVTYQELEEALEAAGLRADQRALKIGHVPRATELDPDPGQGAHPLEPE